MTLYFLLVIDENGNPKMEAADCNRDIVQRAAEPFKAEKEKYRPMITEAEFTLVPFGENLA